ncbi:MAG TPA: hypothetical protein HA286_05490 [Candidatus Poseidoniaceae archaeon]|nr:MAG TPA: hypothetical protein D7H96_05430 [Candidatus Poseidoniales archaeon]HIH53718.1 hypothetical protein [Candidatus Poseidoniaceae archaeon]
MTTRFTAWVLLSLLLLCVVPMSDPSDTFGEPSEVMTAEGRQLDDVNCSGMTFEDLISYDRADFNVHIDGAWSGAAITATAYAVDARASAVRTDLDGLFDGIPGGNDSWISTDEREAVRSVGPACISDMDTRMAFHDGNGVRDRSDAPNVVKFIEDGLALDERNLVPEDHPQYRQCATFGTTTNCREVPVSATQATEIDLLVEDGQSKNVGFDAIENPADEAFSLSIVTTNMTRAGMVLTFPPVPGLTLGAWAVLDDGVANTEVPAPVMNRTENGNLMVELELDYPESSYPMERELFLDFTTEDLTINNPPEWMEAAPTNGTRIAMPPNAETVEISASEVALWATDQHGWHLECIGTNGWNITHEIGTAPILHRGPDREGEVLCAAVDGYGKTSEDNRTWYGAVPFEWNASLNDDQHVLVEVTPETSTGYSLSANLVQGERTTGNIAMTVTGPAVFDHSTQGLRPGGLVWEYRLTGGGWLASDARINLGLELPNTPPTLTLTRGLDGSNGTMNALGTSIIVAGEVYDPEGETLTLSWRLCGASSYDVRVQGMTWEADVRTIACEQQGVEEYDITVTAEDASGGTTTLTFNVDIETEEVPESSTPTTSEEGGRGVPGPGAGMGLLCLLGAALSRRSDGPRQPAP